MAYMLNTGQIRAILEGPNIPGDICRGRAPMLTNGPAFQSRIVPTVEVNGDHMIQFPDGRRMKVPVIRTKDFKE